MRFCVFDPSQKLTQRFLPFCHMSLCDFKYLRFAGLCDGNGAYVDVLVRSNADWRELQHRVQSLMLPTVPLIERKLGVSRIAFNCSMSLASNCDSKTFGDSHVSCACPVPTCARRSRRYRASGKTMMQETLNPAYASPLICAVWMSGDPE